MVGMMGEYYARISRKIDLTGLASNSFYQWY